ncbi:hypothetical protein [Streptomyces goshikiensis]|uniref:hypothetical protein n=1 Tax=Streptomyces goshikiensis TaxID=1942 RepID=UPI0036793F6B
MDVRKATRHDQDPAPAGKKAFAKPMPHSEPERRTVFDTLKAKFGKRRWAPVDALPRPWPVSRAARLPGRPDSR